MEKAAQPSRRQTGIVSAARNDSRAHAPRVSHLSSGHLASGRLAQTAALINDSSVVQAQTQMTEWMNSAAPMPGTHKHNGQDGFAPQGQVIQCLMTGKSFLARYKTNDSTRATIGKLLMDYGSAWGWGYGYVSEYDGKSNRQKRIQILADLERNIHQHFRASGAERIKQAPESKLMLELLDEVQAEHEKQIGELLNYKDELPVDERKLSGNAKAEIIKNWQSIVEGKGNLRIEEKQKNKVSGLERDHPGFRVKALSSISRLLQGAEGRKLIKEANAGGQDPAQHITIAPVSKKDYDVVEGSRWNKKKKGTLSAGIWEAEALDQSKTSPKTQKDLQPRTFWDLDSDNEPLATYELAARQYKSKGEPHGVIIDKTKYLFNQGTGSTVNYITEHKDSENRVLTKEGDDWREGLSPTSVALGHELGHALRLRRGANVAGDSRFLKLLGIDQKHYEFWSFTDEELVNIKEVENKLLEEKGLAPRIFHKDYKESLKLASRLGLDSYQESK